MIPDVSCGSSKRKPTSYAGGNRSGMGNVLDYYTRLRRFSTQPHLTEGERCGLLSRSGLQITRALLGSLSMGRTCIGVKFNAPITRSVLAWKRQLEPKR